MPSGTPIQLFATAIFSPKDSSSNTAFQFSRQFFRHLSTIKQHFGGFSIWFMATQEDSKNALEQLIML